MANEFYEVEGFPEPNSPGSSQFMRNELFRLQQAFDKLPPLDGNAGRVVRVNATGTALDVGPPLELIELTDVSVDDLTTGDSLYYESGAWVNKTPAEARTTLGLVIGTDVQAQSANLQSFADLSGTANRVPYFTGAGATALTPLTAFGRSLIDDADAATARTTLGLTIGTDVQAQSANLQALAGLTMVADRVQYFTGANTAAATPLTAFGRSLIDDANAAAARTTLGLTIGTDVQASSTSLTNLAALSGVSGFPRKTGAATWTLDTTTYLPSTSVGVTVQPYSDDLAAVAGLGDGPGFVFKNGDAWTLQGSTVIESDPIFEASPAGEITAGDLVDWDTAFGWGDHASAGYLSPASIGTTVQAQSARLQSIAGATVAANQTLYFTGANTAAATPLTAFGRSLIDDANAAAARTTLGLVIGTDVQAQSGTLTSLSNLTPSVNNFIVGDGTNWQSVTGSAAAASLNLAEMASRNRASVEQIQSLSGDVGLTLDRLASASSFVTFDGTSHLTLDWESFLFGSWSVTGSRTLNNPINVIPGTQRILLISASTGTSRTISWGSQYKVPPPANNTVTSTRKLLVSLTAVTATEIVVSWVGYTA